MTQINITTKVLALSLLMNSSVCISANEKPLQDSAKAVEFFANELNFKTNPHGVKSVLNGKTKNVTIIDLRDPKSFAKGHIPGAINMPWSEHNSFDGTETAFPQLRKDGYNYVYCYELLCNLGEKAAKKFASLGYPVKVIAGGFNEWKKHKNPVEKSPKQKGKKKASKQNDEE